jgi:hypothetical protein
MEKRNNPRPRKEKVIGEINSGEVITVPDMAISIKQMLENNSRGIGITRRNDAVFEEQPILKDFTEIEEYAEEAKQRQDDAIKAHNEEQAAKKAAEQKRIEDEAAKAEFEEFKKKQQSPD